MACCGEKSTCADIRRTPWVEIPWFLTPAIGTVARFASRRSTADAEDSQGEIPGPVATATL